MKEFFQSCSQFFEDWGQQLYNTFIEDERYMWLVRGLGNTLIITLGALLIGVVLGTIIAVTKYFSEDRRALRFFVVFCTGFLPRRKRGEAFVCRKLSCTVRRGWICEGFGKKMKKMSIPLRSSVSYAIIKKGKSAA